MSEVKRIEKLGKNWIASLTYRGDCDGDRWIVHLGYRSLKPFGSYPPPTQQVWTGATADEALRRAERRTKVGRIHA